MSDMNDKEYQVIQELKDQLDTWLNIMQEDAHFAVPSFMLEMWFNRLLDLL